MRKNAANWLNKALRWIEVKTHNFVNSYIKRRKFICKDKYSGLNVYEGDNEMLEILNIEKRGNDEETPKQGAFDSYKTVLRGGDVDFVYGGFFNKLKRNNG